MVLLRVVILGLTLSIVGCGSTVPPPTPLSEEEEKALENQLQEAAAQEGRGGHGKE
jgi:hypothetical protein